MTIETHKPFEEKNELENRQSFIDRISHLSPLDQKFIMYAYDIPKTSHGHMGQVRDSGIRYFEHPRSVALVLMDELNIYDPELIAACLLHDVFEDTPFFGNAKYNTYKENIEDAQYRIGRSFSARVARIVLRVSKPKGKDIEILDDNLVDEMYHNNLQQSEPDEVVVKLCDRKHNLSTQGSTTPEKQLRKVKETEEYYFPLLSKLEGTVYEPAGRILEKGMRNAISVLNLPQH